MRRFPAIALTIALVVAVGVTVALTPRQAVSVGPTGTAYRGVDAYTWAMRYKARGRQIRNVRRVLFHDAGVGEAIELAGAAYGNTPALWRRAKCETGGTFDPRARNNPSADSPMGLFQFKPSTWRSTPFHSFSIWSPYASSLAAGWMVTVGRGGEWTCR